MKQSDTHPQSLAARVLSLSIALLMLPLSARGYAQTTITQSIPTGVPLTDSRSGIIEVKPSEPIRPITTASAQATISTPFRSGPPLGDSNTIVDVPLAIALSEADSKLATASPDSISTPSPTPRTQFLPDQQWPDNNGVHINAHGGGVMFHEGIYYWFGEHKISGDEAEVGVHVYSSTDLYNWKEEGIAMAVSDDPQSEIARGCIIERPKVIYNAKTKKFVMWFHLERKGKGRKDGVSGVAVADSPIGPYTFQRAVRPDAGIWPINVTEHQKAGLEEAQQLIGTAFWGSPHPDRAKMNFLGRDFYGGQMAKDMTLFVDDDGKAYHVFSSEENSALHISQLSDDYLSHSGKWVRIFECLWHEAPAIFKHEGRYWMLSSHCTGWNPNAARSAVADSIWGPWMELGNPCVGPTPHERLGPDLTFGGQSTHVLPVQGRPGAFIAMFDVWRPENHIAGGYVWLPVKFEKDRFTISWRDAWDLSVF